MRGWPWVSRLAFDLMQADRDFWRDYALRGPQAALFPSLMPIAPAGSIAARGNENQKIMVGTTTGGPTWDEVGAAVSARAGANGALRAHLAAFAQQQRAVGMSNTEIIRRITDWSYKGSEISPTAERDREEAEAEVARLLDAD